MEEFRHYSLSRQALNIRAAHALCRAGWMLIEINGVLQSGYIRPGNFRIIQQQATTFDQLQQKFGPPLPASTSTAEIDFENIDTSKLPRIRVMNRGVEEATAVLVHYGWTGSQIRKVLKSTNTPLGNIGFSLLHERYATSHGVNRYFSRIPHYPYHRAAACQRRSKAAAIKTLLIMFGVGVFTFMGVLLILHML